MEITVDIVNVEIELEIIYCAECGVGMALPPFLIENRRIDGQVFYCPNGHRNRFVDESEETGEAPQGEKE